MADKDAFSERERALEDEYFHRKDRELVEKLRRRAEVEDAIRGMARATGLKDDDILRDLYERGITADTVTLLHLVPLIQVAWAEGGVAGRERAMIVDIARAHGVEAGSEADRQLAEWLSKKPQAGLFDAALRVLRVMMASLPEERQANSHRSLLDYCRTIASLSGGVLGIGRISNEEQELLNRIAAELERDRPEASRKAIG
jgi:hypothetical protein